MCESIESEAALLKQLNQLDACHGEPEIKNDFLHFLHEHYVIPTAWNKFDDAHVDALTKRLTQQDLLSKMVLAQQ